LGIEVLLARNDMHDWLAPLASADSTACALAERSVSRVLGGSCQVPLAAYATVSGASMSLRALVADPDGSRVVRAQASGPVGSAVALGEAVAKELLKKGANTILAKLAAANASAS
jgi:hydroxymethylbilane synthase